MIDYSFTAPLWQWEGKATWFFVTVPHHLTDEIEDTAPLRGGFGSVKVDVQVGSSRWQTSLFPDKGRASFILPVKKAVREREGLRSGHDVEVSLTLVS